MTIRGHMTLDGYQQVDLPVPGPARLGMKSASALEYSARRRSVLFML